MNRLLEAEKLNNSNITRNEIYLTLIALYVLKNEFGDRQREWGFQANRAK